MNKYDDYMDKECIAICDALNELPGVETSESCCGHYNNIYQIFLRCNNWYSLGIISRAFNKRYSGTSVVWKVELETADAKIDDYPQFRVYIHSIDPYTTEDYLKKDLEELINNIKYWSQEEFKVYFNYE